MSSVRDGPCGKFRYDEYPVVKVGLVHLDRKRPWPSCVNPETGHQWSDDVKTKMLDILTNTGHPLLRSDQVVSVNDDPSLRTAIGECAIADIMMM